MPNFDYTAVDQSGQETSGTVSANSEAEAQAQLRSQGFYLKSLGPAGKGRKKSKGKKGRAAAPKSKK